MLIVDGHVVDPATGLHEIADVLIEQDCIKKIYVRSRGEQADYNEAQENGHLVIDAKGKYVMPGFIDLHVHFRDPGLTYKEDIITGSRAAAAGGVTTVCAMPNTKPVVDNVEVLQDILQRAEHAYVHVKQLSSITKGMEGKELVDMEAMLKAGAVAFSEDGKSVMDIRVYREAMKKAAELGAVIMAHCEDKDLVGKGVLNEGVASEKFGVPGIPNSVEDVITARDIFLAHETGAKLHICHCSTIGTVELMRMAKRLGAHVTAEVCPHHFTLTDADIKEANSNYKMNLPLRTEKDVKALVEGLVDGTMPAISTDHAPHSAEEKAQFFDKAPFGIVGLETSAALTYTALVAPGLMDIMDMATKMSYNPAKIIGIDDKYGRLTPGAKADIVIFDPEETWVVDPIKFESKGHNTPYTGQTLVGKVLTTIVDGELRYNGAIIEDQ